MFSKFLPRQLLSTVYSQVHKYFLLTPNMKIEKAVSASEAAIIWQKNSVLLISSYCYLSD